MLSLYVKKLLRIHFSSVLGCPPPTRLERAAFQICSKSSGDQIGDQIGEQQAQRKAGCAGLKRPFGTAVRGVVRNLRGGIMNVMELNMSFINQVSGFFFILGSFFSLFKGLWLFTFFAFFS